MSHLRATSACIVANRLTYRHADGTPLFGPLAFSLPAGRYGLVGPNGAGKSTLLRLIAAELDVPYLEQRDPEHAATTLSGGERVRYRMGRLIGERPAWLLLDEPSNHLDGEGRRALYAAIDRWGDGLVVASHDRDLLERVDRILELRPQEVRIYGGAYSAYDVTRRAEDAAALRELGSARALLARERRDLDEALENARRGASHGEARARKKNLPKVLRGALARRAQNTAAKRSATHEDRLDRAADRLATAREAAPEERRIALDLPQTAVPASKTVALCPGLNASFADGSSLWPADLSLEIVGPRRIAISGPNGSGKSMLLRMLAGQARVPAACLDQHLSFLPDGLTLVAAMREAAPQLCERDRRIRLGRLLFEGDRALTRTGLLSGGERVRAALALLLWSPVPPQLLLLDEPDNNLDAASLAHVADALRSYRGALVAVSHNPAFLAAIGTETEITLPPRSQRRERMQTNRGRPSP